MQQEKTVGVTINHYSQPHVLRHRMLENELTHGQTVMADLNPVRIEGAYGQPVMYFCPMQTMHVKQKIQPGDGGVLPVEATLKGIKLPINLPPGLYNLKNVMLHSNGTMQVIATEATAFEPYDHESQVVRGTRSVVSESELVLRRMHTMENQRYIEYERSGCSHFPF